jgi:outer membrane lipoprotein-sorting protein
MLKGRLVLVGEEKVADRNASVIEVKQDENSQAGPGSFSKVWIDTSDYCMLKAQSRTPNGIAESRFSDFRKVQGDFSMPFLHEVYMDGVLQSKSVTKSVKLNSGLSDDLFDGSKLQSQGMSLEDMMKGSTQGK